MYRREDEAANQEVGLGCADPDLEREMLSQRLGVERLAGLRIGHQAANMLLREAQPGQGFDALLGIRQTRHATRSLIDFTQALPSD